MRFGQHIYGGILCAALTCVAEPSSPWPAVGEGVEVDPAIHWGELDNGLRYAIKRQPHPAGSVSLRMIVRAGSLHETPAEVGIAHFVEHMAFNGTNKFRKETMGPKLAAQGIRFGPDLTAFTYPSHTIYHLDLPNSDAAKIDLAATILREWASEVRFDRRQVEREKGVILAEYLSRGENASKLYSHRLDFLYPDSLLSQRPPVSDRAEIDSVTPQQLRRFYEEWYRPDNTILIAAGDFEVTDVEAEIRRKFADWARPTQSIKELDLGEIRNDSRTRARLVSNPEVKAFAASLTLVEPATTPETLADRKRHIRLGIALSAFNKRLRGIVLKSPGKFGQLNASMRVPTPFAKELSISASGQNSNWKEVVSVIIDEYRRLLIHGFHEDELVVPKANLLRSSEFATRHGTTETAQGLAARLARIVTWGKVPSSTEFNYRITQEVLEELTADQCLAAIEPFFSEGFPGMFITAAYLEELSAEEVNAHLNLAIEHELEPPELPEIKVFPYVDFGEPGKVISHDHDTALDVHMVRFENGIRLNLKRTDFAADSVHLTARIDNGGRLRQTENRPGMAMVAEASLMLGGLEKIDWEGITNALAGQFVKLNFKIQEDRFSWRGSADSRETELLLQLFTAYLTEPAMRTDAIQQGGNNVYNWHTSSQYTVESALGVYTNPMFYGEDTRFMPPDWNQLNKVSFEELKAWLLWTIRSGELEIGLVGDLDVDETIQFAAATVGTLPIREEVPYHEEVELQRESLTRSVNVESTDHKGGIMIAWPMQGTATARGRRTAEILSWILRARIAEQVRENLGIAYSPSVNRWVSLSQPDSGFMRTVFIVDPQLIMQVFEQTKQIAQELSRGNITNEELERAKRPLIEGVDQQLNANGYWLAHVVSDAQTDPEALVMPHTRKSDLENISLAEIKAVAEAIFSANDELILIASPPIPSDP